MVADDHPLILRGISQLLADHPDIELVGEASSGPELTELVEQTSADVALVDIGMPGPGFYQVIRALREKRPQLAILALSGRPASEYAVRVIRAGANGYVSKDSIGEELVHGIRRAAAGHNYVSSSATDSLVDLLREDRAEVTPAELSDRELEVLRCSALGWSVKQIGKHLDISPKTVSTYRRRILEKLGLESQAEAVRYAVRFGIVDDPEPRSSSDSV